MIGADTTATYGLTDTSETDTFPVPDAIPVPAPDEEGAPRNRKERRADLAKRRRRHRQLSRWAKRRDFAGVVVDYGPEG